MYWYAIDQIFFTQLCIHHSGKLVPSHGVAYVAHGGSEHGHSDYEVMCACAPHWIQVQGDQIPPTAVPGKHFNLSTIVARISNVNSISI